MRPTVRRSWALPVAAALAFGLSACAPVVTFRFGDASTSSSVAMPEVTPVDEVPAEVRAAFPAGEAPTYRLQTADVELWLPGLPVKDEPYVFPDGSSETAYFLRDEGYSVFIEQGLSERYSTEELIDDIAHSDESLEPVRRERSTESRWRGLTRTDAAYSSGEDGGIRQDQISVVRDGGAAVIVEWFGPAVINGDPDQVLMSILESASIHFTDTRSDRGQPDGATRTRFPSGSATTKVRPNTSS